MNIRLLIEYDGTGFCGWQRQVTGPSIQASLEDVLELIHGKRTIVYGSSRTDSGVHALGQVATFFTSKEMEPERWARVLNFHLPRSIRVLRSERTLDSFDPQSATEKEYEYVILNRPIQSALNPRVYFIPRPLDWGRIREAMPQFLGTHDFRAFQGAKAEVRTTVRTVKALDLYDRGDGFFAFRIRGTGFLKQMVRTMIGTLVEIGLRKRYPGDIERILASRDRQQAGHTAPACGLTLIRVYFGSE